MKKSFIPLTALALIAMVSCAPAQGDQSSSSGGDDTSSVDEVVNSVTITNKADIEATWPLETANRTLAITTDPAGNVNQLIANGKMTIASSNEEVVAVVGRVLTAKGAGTATVTVAYGGKSDSVNVTITAAESAITLYGTVHAGTENDPLDNADAIKVAKAVGTTETEKFFYIKGTVDSFSDGPSNKHGNVTYKLKSDTSEKFTVFRAVMSKDLKADGKVTEDDIWVGAIATVKAKIVNYNNNTPETSQGGEIVKVEGTKPVIETHNVTVAEAIAATKALEGNAVSVDKYVITGYIVATSADGFYIADAKGKINPTQDDFLVYGYSGENAASCTLNAKVKVTCTLKYYVSTSTQGKYAVETGTIESVDILEEGDAPVKLEEITTTRAIEIANALELGKTSDKQYIITGYVKEVTTAYSTQHNNMTFTFGETADATDVLTAFRSKVANGTDYNKIVAGAKIKVTAYLQKYNKEGTGVLQAANATTEVVEEAIGKTVNATVAEAVTAASKLASDAVSTDTYIITGYVTKIKDEYNEDFGNISFFMSDAMDDPNATFLAFRITCTAELAATFLPGAKVKVTGKLTKYNTTLETNAGGTAEVLEAASGTAVTASISKKALTVGETTQITATAGEGDTFTYASSAPAVATVSDAGLVTAVASGKATITVTSSAGRKGYIDITVSSANEFVVTSFSAVSGTLGDTGYSYTSLKGTANTAPVINNNTIRLYQNGATFTISTTSETAKAISSVTITSDGLAAGEGPFSYVYGASETTATQSGTGGAWSSHEVTVNFEGDGAKYFKLTTTGTDKTSRVYVKGLKISFVD